MGHIERKASNMHLSRDTHQSLNESIKSINLGENYQLLTEEEYSEVYDDFIEFVAENYTEEQVINSSAEELLEGFWDNIKSAWTQFKRGAAGELTWSGAEKYPAKKEEKPTEKTDKDDKSPISVDASKYPDAKERTVIKPKTTGTSDKPVRPSILGDKSKSTSSPEPTPAPTAVSGSKRTKESGKIAPDLFSHAATEHFPKDKVLQRAYLKGLIDKEGKPTPKQLEFNNRILKSSDEYNNTYDKIMRDYKKMSAEKRAKFDQKNNLGSGENALHNFAHETAAKKHGLMTVPASKGKTRPPREREPVMASKEYYSDLRQRLIENYKK